MMGMDTNTISSLSLVPSCSSGMVSSLRMEFAVAVEGPFLGTLMIRGEKTMCASTSPSQSASPRHSSLKLNKFGSFAMTLLCRQSVKLDAILLRNKTASSTPFAAAPTLLLTERACLDTCGDETTFGHMGFGPSDGNQLMKRLKGKMVTKSHKFSA